MRHSSESPEFKLTACSMEYLTIETTMLSLVVLVYIKVMTGTTCPQVTITTLSKPYEISCWHHNHLLGACALGQLFRLSLLVSCEVLLLVLAATVLVGIVCLASTLGWN